MFTDVHIRVPAEVSPTISQSGNRRLPDGLVCFTFRHVARKGMDKIFADAVKNTKPQSQTSEQQSAGETPKKLPKGVVLGKDGKP